MWGSTQWVSCAFFHTEKKDDSDVSGAHNIPKAHMQYIKLFVTGI
jgi:hypothetical protein